MNYYVVIVGEDTLFYDSSYEDIDSALRRARSLSRSLKNTSLEVLVLEEKARYPKRKARSRKKRSSSTLSHSSLQKIPHERGEQVQ